MFHPLIIYHRIIFRNFLTLIKLYKKRWDHIYGIYTISNGVTQDSNKFSSGIANRKYLTRIPENLKIQNRLPTAHAGCEIGRKESSASHENHLVADISTASFLNNYVFIIHYRRDFCKRKWEKSKNLIFL